jgi:hypothetical protein
VSEYNESGDIIDGFTQDRAVVTGAYQLGPGIVLDAEAAYTWIDTDPSRPQAVSISTTAMRSKSAWGPV